MEHTFHLKLVSQDFLRPEQIRDWIPDDITVSGMPEDFLDIRCQEICRELIIEQGTSFILTSEMKKALLPKSGPQSKYLLINTLAQMLTKLSPTSSLIVIDPYLFPQEVKDRNDYLKMFGDVFSSTITNINRINVVTKTNFNKDLYRDVKALILGINARINIIHNTTEDFHDRFWIVDEKSGLFVGTSLNGIGKKYALTDYIAETDVEDLVKIFRNLRLI